MINTFDVKAGETRTNSTLYGLNRFETAKKTGANGENEYADLLVLLNGLFENQLARGIRTEDDFDSYMATFPNGKTPFIYPNQKIIARIKQLTPHFGVDCFYFLLLLYNNRLLQERKLY